MPTRYLKKPFNAEAADALRIQLSVQEPKRGPEPVCDWCAGPGVTLYAATELSTGEKTPCWRWLACAECERAIDAGAWDTLRARMSRRLRSIVRVPVSLRWLDEVIKKSLKEFFKYALRVENLPPNPNNEEKQ